MIKSKIKLLVIIGLLFFTIGAGKRETAPTSQIQGYLFPLEKPIMVHGKILCTSWYSKIRSEQINGKWTTYQYKALNYPAKYGDNIIAPFDAVVEATSIGGYEGGTITLRSIEYPSITVRICHMSDFEVAKYTKIIEKDVWGNTTKEYKEKTKVKRGEIIGYVGTSGRTTGSHIRVVFEKNGERFFVSAEIWGKKYTDFEYSKTEFDATKTMYYADNR